MTPSSRFGPILALSATTALAALGGASAQQVTGVLGAPSATTTIEGRQLPPPPPAFGGEIREQALESTQWWAPRVVPPEGAPNILVIMTDDSGFGVPSTFGGVIPTAAMDQLAEEGLRYTAIHSTALCSPTRAALLTGRNHHTAGFGVISEQSTGFPSYNSIIEPDKATIGRVLREHGYATSWFGKNHNVPAFAASQAGPFDQWPVGMGFEYFYGFIGGDANHWQPNLFRNTTQIYPFEGQPGWNLNTAMADDAIRHITELNQIDPSKPFFVKYTPGAVHAPHHPTQEWVDRIVALNLFEEGYEALRETIFENQKRLGYVPAEATLAPWPDADLIKPWDTLTDDEKRLFIRQADIFAAFVAYTDHEIGRVIQAIRDMGKFDDTLIIYINGDNGTSAEGGPLGSPNEVAFFNGLNAIPAEVQMQYFDVWGSEHTYNHMSAGWSWAFNTPFDWFKQNASRLGGVRQNMVVSWPNRIADKGGVRDQFMHVVDVTPTILDVVGVPAPEVVDGIPQAPIDGVSFAYTFDDADAPSARRTQYFEMMGQWALYHDGWLLATEVNRAPWQAFGAANPDPLNNQVLQLYDLTTDPNQTTDVAAYNPDKVAEMKALFVEEARTHNVFPMDASVAARVISPRPNITAGRTEFVYTTPMVGLPQGSSPLLLNTSYTITAEIEVPEGGAEGMILTSGGRFGGYGFYLLEGRPVFLWNLVDLNRIRWAAPDPLPPGRHIVEFDFVFDGLGVGTLAYNDMSGLGASGTGTLRVNAVDVQTQRMERTLGMILQWDESFDIGSDTLTGVNDADYTPPFALTAKLEKLTIKLDRPQLSEADRARLEGAMRAASGD